MRDGFHRLPRLQPMLRTVANAPRPSLWEVSGRRQIERDVHHPPLPLCREPQAACFEYFEHGNVLREHLGEQISEPSSPSDGHEMLQQGRPYPLTLMLIDNRERKLSPAGLHDDVSSAADDRTSAVLVDKRNQSDMFDEVDVQKECDLLLAEVPLGGEETTEQRLRAGAADRSDDLVVVLRPQRADLQRPPVVQRLHCGIFGGLHRDT
jgi:hypothetical protein